MEIIKAWINQPSKQQPFYKYHGKIGIAVLGKDKATFVIHDNEKTPNMKQFEVPLSCISKL